MSETPMEYPGSSEFQQLEDVIARLQLRESELAQEVQRQQAEIERLLGVLRGIHEMALEDVQNERYGNCHQIEADARAAIQTADNESEP